MFTDQTIQCQVCGQDFIFTAGEQEFFQERGFQEPRKCKDCRQQTKGRKQGGGGRFNRSRPPARQLYDIVCDACGQAAQVPFEPYPDHPVYCKACYTENKGAMQRQPQGSGAYPQEQPGYAPAFSQQESTHSLFDAPAQEPGPTAFPFFDHGPGRPQGPSFPLFGEGP